MLSEISRHLREKFRVFPLTDQIIFNNKIIDVNPDHFQVIPLPAVEEAITYIDGGQAELLSGGNLHLSFLRVAAQTMQGAERQGQEIREWYLLTTALYREGEIWYQGKLYGPPLVEEQHLLINSTDASLREGRERAPISKVASMTRRFLELAVASQFPGRVILDGTLQATFRNEEDYLCRLGENASALAKTCSLFTTSGNNPVILLQRLNPRPDCWSYPLAERSCLVRLHPKAKHVFRFEGSKEALPFLVENSKDSLFPGYPYGLILADQLARVSNEEKNSLRMQILLRQENRELVEYLNAMNAHEILDRMG